VKTIVIFKKSSKCGNGRLVSHSWCRKKRIKAESCRPTVVTKLLQKSEETVSAMAYMQDFVNGEDFCPFIKEPQSRKSGSITPEIFSN